MTPHPTTILHEKMASPPDPPAGHTRPVVFFDVAIGDTKLPRIKMELFDDIVPKCVRNGAVVWRELMLRIGCVGLPRISVSCVRGR